jgi:glyoxylase-like metal-dependent hydrolase (beta-lactamase superfamily II)
MPQPFPPLPGGELRLPWPEPPPFGQPVEVAPGILWLRLALPFALDHVNLYLLEDRGGWAVFDTGISDTPSQLAWEHVLAEALGGRPITRLVVSHYHPDHVGLAGWLDRRFDMPLYMSQTEYLLSRLLQIDRSEDFGPAGAEFYRSTGLDPVTIEQVLTRGHSYLKRTTGLAPRFRRLTAGDTIELGGRDWQVLTGGGHALEQVMLWCKADRLFLSADQVLARISPNVSVQANEPEANPLGLYLASLAAIRDEVSDEVLVLPCHNLPFEGLHARIEQLETHHLHRCDLIAAAAVEPVSCADVIPIIFRRPLADPHQLSFAVGEALAHLNYMLRLGVLIAEPDAGGTLRYRKP